MFNARDAPRLLTDVDGTLDRAKVDGIDNPSLALQVDVRGGAFGVRWLSMALEEHRGTTTVVAEKRDLTCCTAISLFLSFSAGYP